MDKQLSLFPDPEVEEEKTFPYWHIDTHEEYRELLYKKFKKQDDEKTNSSKTK